MRAKTITINLSKKTKEKLLALMNEDSPKAAVKKLLDMSEKPSELIESNRDESTNIRLDPDTHKRLDEYRKYSNETNTQLIERLISEMIQ